MGKKIITRQDVEKWFFEGIKEISLDSDTVVLPGARDTLKRAGIRIRPKGSGEEQIKKAVAEYCTDNGIEDPIKEKITKLVIEKYMAKLGGE
jgi:hypothetical protein